MKTRYRQRGVSLVEALVALVVMSVGMLGIASLYVTSLQANRTALARTQAVNIVNDMADRIRANSVGRDAYKTAGFKPEGNPPDCQTKTCSASDVAIADLFAWTGLFGQPTFPPGTLGTVTYDAGANGNPDQYRIELAWKEAGQQDFNRYFVSLQLVPVPK